MKNKLFFSFLALLLITKAISQSTIPVFTKDSSNVNNYLYQYIHANFKLEKYDTMCLSSCTFIKFKINKIGMVDDIHFTYATPEIIKSIFKQALLSTNGFWKYKTKIAQPVTFMLPVVFIFEDKCKPSELSANRVLDILLDDDNPNAAKPGLPGIAGNSILKCIILNPMFLKSGYE